MAQKLLSDDDFLGGAELVSDDDFLGTAEPEQDRSQLDPEAYVVTSEGYPTDPNRAAQSAARREAISAIPDDSSIGGDLRAGVKTLQNVPAGIAMAGPLADVTLGQKAGGSLQELAAKASRLREQADGLRDQLFSERDPEKRQEIQNQISALHNQADAIMQGAGPATPLTPEDVQIRVQRGLDTLVKILPGVIQRNEEIAAIPTNPAATEFLKAEGDTTREQIGSMWDALASDPTGVTRTFVLRSLPASAPSIVGAIVGEAMGGPGGAAALAGIAGTATEYGTAISDAIATELTAAGVDIKDKAAIQGWVEQNVDTVFDIIAKARTGSLAVGAFDAAGAGISGRLAGGAMRGPVDEAAAGVGTAVSSLGRKAGAEVLSTATEAATGASGELSKQLLTEDEVSIGDVAAEAIGEAGTGAPMVTGQMAVESLRNKGKTPPAPVPGGPAPDEQAALSGAPVPPAPDTVTPSGNAVAPDEQVALTPGRARDLAKDVLKSQQGAQDPNAAAQPSPADTAAVPPAGATAPSGEAAPVQGEASEAVQAAPEPETVPEAPQTLAEQAAALVDRTNKRKAMYIPDETLATGDFVEPEGRVIGRVVVDGGVIYFNKAKGYTRNDILKLYRENRLGAVLGLGEVTKRDAAASIARGAAPVAVTERTPEGVEVKAASGSSETAPEQIAALEEQKTPGNIVSTEPVSNVIEQRVAARETPAAVPAPTPTPAPVAPVNQPTIQDQVAEAIRSVESEKEAATPLPPAPPDVPAPVTRGEEVKAASRKRSQPVEVTPPGAKGRVFMLPTPKDIAEATERYNSDVVSRLKNSDLPPAAQRKEAASEARAEQREVIAKKVSMGELKDHISEANELIATSGSNLTKADKDLIRDRARISGAIMDEFAPDEFSTVSSAEEKAALKERLNAIVAAADKAGFPWSSRKGVGVHNTRSVTWLHDVRTYSRKLNAGRAKPDELNTFLADEVAAKRGDISPTIARRKEVGEQFSKPAASGADTGRIAATETAPVEEAPLEEAIAAEEAAADDDAAPSVIAAQEADASDIKASVPASKRGAKIKAPTETAEVKTATGETRKVERAVAASEAKSREDLKAEYAAKYNTTGGKKPIPKPAPKEEKAVPEKVTVADEDITADDIKSSMKKFLSGGTLGGKDQAVMKYIMAQAEKTPGATKLIEDAVAANDPDKNKMVVEVMATIIRPKKTKISTIRGSGGDGAGVGVNADGDREAAIEVVTFTEMAKRLTTDEALANVGGTLRSFSMKHRFVQRAVAKQVFNALSSVIGNVKIYIIPDAHMLKNNPDMPGLDGYYDPMEDYIAVRERNLTDLTSLLHVVMHEGSHAAMVHAIEMSSRLRRSVEYLFHKVLVRAVDDGRYDSVGDYGFTNLHEFMAEVWANPEFQEYLGGVPITKDEVKLLDIRGGAGSRVKSALSWLKYTIGRLLGIERTLNKYKFALGDKSAFEVAMSMSEDILAIAPAARKKHFDKILGAKPLSRLASVSKGKKEPEMPEGVSRHSIEGRLIARGVRRPDAEDVAALLREELAGTVSPETLDAIAERVKAEYDKVTSVGKTAQKKLESQYSKSLGGIRDRVDKGSTAAGKALDKDFVPERNPGRPMKAMLAVATNFQIAQIGDRFFGKESNPLRKIAEAIENRRITKARYLREITPVIEDLMAGQRRHSEKQWGEFQELIQDATMANVHPDRSLEDNTHLSKAGLRDTWNREQHAGLAARYDALPDDLKQLYARTRDTLTDTQNRLTYKLIENILRAAEVETTPGMADRFHDGTATDEDKKAVGPQIARHLENAVELKKIKGPYFNLIRRGRYMIHGKHKVEVPAGAKLVPDTENVVEFTSLKEAQAYAKAQPLRSILSSVWVDKNTGETWVTDDDGKEVRISSKDADAVQRWRVDVQNRHVEFFDTRSEASRAHKALKEAGLQMADKEPKRYEYEAANSEMLSGQMRALSETIDKGGIAGRNLSAAQKAEVRAALSEASIRFLGSTRIQSSRLPRRYILGASKDITRNTFEYVDSASGYLARLETAPMLEDALEELEKRVKSLSARGTGAGEGARLLSNAMESRAYRTAVGEDDGLFAPLSRRITAFAFLDALMSPAYSLINATQVGMFTMPYLAGDFSIVRANAALLKAYHDVGAARMTLSGVRDTTKAVFGKMVTGDHFIDDVKSRLSSKSERDMIDELADVGLIDADGGLEIARVLDSMKPTVGGWIDRRLHYLDNIARAMPQTVEAINRTVTALAAYRLKYKETGNHERAVQYAKDAVNDTQALMSNSNAAPIFSHPVARVSLQFKKFGQMAYYLFGKQIGRVLRPMEKGERIRGIKSLAGLVAMHQAAAGMLGLPIEPFKVALMIFSGLGGLDYEWEDFEEDVREAAEKLFGERAAENITYGVTRELGVDLNSRLGLDSLLLFGEPRSYESSEVQSYILQTLLGPSGRTGFDAVSTIPDMVDGDFSTVHKLVPVKILSDIGKAVQGRREGTMDTQDQILRGIGFTSGRQARIYDDIGSEIRARQKAKNLHDELVRDYIKARGHDEIVDARRAIARYNRDVPEGQRKISFPGLDKIRRAQKKQYEVD